MKINIFLFLFLIINTCLHYYILVLFQTKSTIVTILNKIVEPAWGKMAEGLKTIAEKIEPPIRAGIEPILRLKVAIQDKLRCKYFTHYQKYTFKYQWINVLIE